MAKRKWENTHIRIETLEELLRQEVVYFYSSSKPYNRVWVLNQQVGWLIQRLEFGAFEKARRIDYK